MCPANSKTTQSYSCLSSPTVLPLAPNREEDSFKLIVQAFKAFHFSSPGYLSSYFQSRVHKTKYSLRSDLAITFEVPRAKKNKRAIVPFLWLGLIFGMGCRAVPYCRSYGQVQKQT